MTRLNLDPVRVVNVRTLPGGQVEALLDVSGRDYQRLLVEPLGMHYSIAGADPEEGAKARDLLYEVLQGVCNDVAHEEDTYPAIVPDRPDAVMVGLVEHCFDAQGWSWHEPGTCEQHGERCCKWVAR